MGQSNSRKPLRVFISYAAKDADWKAERVEEVASAIESAGFEVWLDLWRSRHIQASEASHAWHMWINEAILGADYVLCLASSRYLSLWEPGFEREAPLGKKARSKIHVAEESMRLLQEVFNGQRRRNPRYICTLRLSGRSEEVIPKVLFQRFPAYQWTKDREELISHFGAVSDGASPIKQAIGYAAADVAGVAAEISAKLSGASSAKLDPKSVARVESPVSAVSAENMQPQKGLLMQLGNELAFQFVSRAMWQADDAKRAPVGDFPPPWASAWGDDVYGLWADLTVNGATQRMRWIEPSGPEGFWMGAPQQERDEILDLTVRDWANAREQNPVRQVILCGFWLADTPCTQQFWQVILGHNVSHFQSNADSLFRPVELVRREDIENFFVQLSVLLKIKAADLCLPTEMQWEYAARAGTATAYWWGDKPDNSYANWDSAHQGTTPVKSFPPNHWGLFDMHGNVWERCENGWLQNLGQPDSQIDNSLCAVRGGSWLDKPASSRSAYRGWRPRRGSNLDLGFRFLLLSGSQSGAAVSAR